MKLRNLYTVSQYAKLFGISRPTVYTYIKDGKIRTTRIGGRLFIRVSDKVLETIENQ